jgi:hypothetical protein
MSSITARLVSRLDQWLDRVTMTDDRYICAACDDRFASRSLGIDHVLHCHPEYQGVVVYDGQQAQPATITSPVRTGRSAPLALPVPVSH